jgi:hypothetical protein
MKITLIKPNTEFQLNNI